MCEIYVNSLDMRISQHSGTVDMIMPFFMLDAQYMIYCSDVRDVKVSHKAREWKNRWQHNYGLLNRGFFRLYTIDQQIELTEKMDEFEKYIANDIMVAKVQVMNLLTDLPMEQQAICASLIVCNLLAQSAMIVWNDVYKFKNKFIAAIEKCSSKFMNFYHESISKAYVNPNESIAISNAVDALCKKMVRWMMNDKENAES